jgi:hypothetical protein
VDRGQHSLETITLLLALKVEYPLNVHLIRGNHEAADINALFGFRIECIERMVMTMLHSDILIRLFFISCLSLFFAKNRVSVMGSGPGIA